MDKVYVVGLTGPTGSGKSEVSRRLTEAQLPVIDADVARRAVEPGTECLKRLAETFSEDILKRRRGRSTGGSSPDGLCHAGGYRAAEFP